MKRARRGTASLLAVTGGLLAAGAGAEEPALRATFHHPDDVLGVAFFPDGKAVASACTDKVARVWDVATGKVVQTFRHGDELWSVAVAADGRTVVTGNW